MGYRRLRAGWCFNPLPSPKQGETRVRQQHHLKAVGFNPLPSPKQGETVDRHRMILVSYCFNPLPSPKQGETVPTRCSDVPRTCFNPLPSPKQGETGGYLLLNLAVIVSIRSPHRSKGRPFCLLLCWFNSAFQSAPLTEARGDGRLTA